MMKPFTCLCLLAAAGSLLYLYQEKHSAQVMDRQIGGLIKQAEQVRERTGLMRAEYAMLNDPERLGQLAAQHLALQQLAPAQFAKLADLGSRLPGPVAAAPEPAAMDDAPSAGPAAIPPTPVPAAPVASPVVAATTPATPRPPVMAAAVAPIPPAAKIQLATATPPTARRTAKPQDEPSTVLQVASQPPRPSYAPGSGYAPIVPAFASHNPAPATSHPPTVQRASAGLPDSQAAYAGSALGMAHTALAPPVPVSDNNPGAAYGR